VCLWDRTTGTQRRRFGGADAELTSLAYSPDGKSLAGGGGEGTVHLWEAGTGREVRRFTGPGFGVRSVAFAPDGKTLAAGGEDNKVFLWETATGKELGRLEGHDHFVAGVTFSPDGKLLASASLDRTVRLWDVAGLREVRKLTGHEQYVAAVAFSPDGRLLASASWDRTVRLWEVATGQPVAVIPTDPHGVGCVVISPDGRLLATAGFDGTARLWEVATGKEVHHFARGGMALAFSPDGRTLAAGQGDTTVLLWDLPALPAGPHGPVAELSPPELDGLWKDLAGGDAPKAYQAVGRLVAAPASSVPFLRDRLGAPRAADPELEKRLGRLIADLDSDNFATRERATAGLADLGTEAEPALRRALERRPTVEARRRIEGLLEKVGTPGLSPDRLRASRALLALEQIDTPTARRAIDDLARGQEGAWLTREAQAAQARLQKRAAAAP
jgi:dipeptidyl aminopeptidase/acylaminoacyl peptidase